MFFATREEAAARALPGPDLHDMAAARLLGAAGLNREPPRTLGGARRHDIRAMALRACRSIPAPASNRSATKPVIGHLEDRRLFVLVDRDDDLAVLHARKVLDRPPRCRPRCKVRAATTLPVWPTCQSFGGIARGRPPRGMHPRRRPACRPVLRSARTARPSPGRARPRRRCPRWSARAGPRPRPLSSTHDDRSDCRGGLHHLDSGRSCRCPPRQRSRCGRVTTFFSRPTISRSGSRCPRRFGSARTCRRRTTPEASENHH